MTKELIERLRSFSCYPEAARSHEGLTTRFRDSLGVAHDTMLEAADRLQSLSDTVERLTAALAQIAFLRPAGDTKNQAIIRMERIALDALAAHQEHSHEQ